MKKPIVSLIMVSALVILFTSGALALSYDGGTFNPDVTLSTNNPLWFNIFSRPSTGSLETAILDLKFEAATPSQIQFPGPFGPIKVDIQPNGVIFTNNAALITSTLHNGVTSFSFTGNTLAALNSAIKPSGVPIGLYLLNGSIELNSAHLFGTMKGPVAPEPISLALVAAGLVGLPFARRLRKVMRKES